MVLRVDQKTLIDDLARDIHPAHSENWDTASEAAPKDSLRVYPFLKHLLQNIAEKAEQHT